MASKKNDEPDFSSDMYSFLSSYGAEFFSKQNRLKDIIGASHWLTVGEHRERLLRNYLRGLLPKSFSVDSGFIMAYNREGELIRSKQQDIIIWNSNKFSPIYKDQDFVIVPPEACNAVIEVKKKLTSVTLREALENTDNFYRFQEMKYSYVNHPIIRRFIFAYEQDAVRLETTAKRLESIYLNAPDGGGLLTIEKRLEYSKEATCYGFPNLICIASKGILANIRNSTWLTTQLTTLNGNEELICSLFFKSVLTHLVYSCGDTPCHLPNEQPGLASIYEHGISSGLISVESIKLFWKNEKTK
jgi:hypothetical protein